MSALQLFSLVPLFGMLCIAAVIDWRERRIPNWLTLLSVASGIAGSFLAGHVAGPSEALLGMIVGFAIPFVLFVMGALGGGDVKLLAGVGAWLGPVGAVKVFLAAAVVGMIIVLIQSAKQKRLSALFRNSAVLTVNLVNIDILGADAVCETGKACRSIERPLPYAVPILVAVLLVIGATT
ncbi:MAG TPA: A24 family peptidase [Tepidisphaeraceae bacterium]|jgi:prepilin peptidase CpaA|nr:A24 family peptidase [Tepidisphaeraceae bacterium]